MEYKISLARMDDMMDIFKLANDPAIRHNSFNQEPISIENHREWYNKKLGSCDCIFYVIRDKHSNLIGYSRFDKIEDQNYFIISVGLEKRFRGIGIGRKIIRQTSCMVEKEKHLEIFAYIKKENCISLESFQRSGYEIITLEDINGVSCYKLRYSR